MTQEELLLKLAFTKGISLINQWKVLRYALTSHYFDFTALEISSRLNLGRYRQLFEKSWRDLSVVELKQSLDGQKFLTYFSPEYPLFLKEIPQPPLVLFYQGKLEFLPTPMLAMVGAREATDYGRSIVEQFVPRLVEANYTIVSGLAKGIDSYSHHAAIQAGGRTIGVLGSGVDVCYPREVYPIYAEMRENHLLLSEFPAGTQPRRYHFPLRNRIIAGLCQGLGVIEAKEKSGSLITAQLALETGREVFAFPGEIISGRSNGCHRLIQDGAKCVVEAQDILSELTNF